VRLQKAAELGVLTNISVRAFNAKHQDCGDAACDLILGRQAYHQVGRVLLAIYRLVHASRRGFSLIELKTHDILLNSFARWQRHSIRFV